MKVLKQYPKGTTSQQQQAAVPADSWVLRRGLWKHNREWLSETKLSNAACSVLSAGFASKGRSTPQVGRASTDVPAGVSTPTQAGGSTQTQACVSTPIQTGIATSRKKKPGRPSISRKWQSRALKSDVQLAYARYTKANVAWHQLL